MEIAQLAATQLNYLHEIRLNLLKGWAAQLKSFAIDLVSWNAPAFKTLTQLPSIQFVHTYKYTYTPEHTKKNTDFRVQK